MRKIIGRITANTVAAWLAGVFYTWGLDAGRRWQPEKVRKLASDRIGEAMGNLLARPQGRHETEDL